MGWAAGLLSLVCSVNCNVDILVTYLILGETLSNSLVIYLTTGYMTPIIFIPLVDSKTVQLLGFLCGLDF